MILVQFLVVLLFLYIGMRVGGIGVGFAGGAGVIVLSALGATPKRWRNTLVKCESV